MLKHNFLYDLGMARLVVTFPDRFFFVDGEKHLQCIEICISDPKFSHIWKNEVHFWGFRTPGGSTANIGLAFGVTFEFDLQAEFVIWHLYIRQRQFSKFPAKLKTPQLNKCLWRVPFKGRFYWAAQKLSCFVAVAQASISATNSSNVSSTRWVPPDLLPGAAISTLCSLSWKLI